jgi:hypothetical protein
MKARGKTQIKPHINNHLKFAAGEYLMQGVPNNRARPI